MRRRITIAIAATIIIAVLGVLFLRVDSGVVTLPDGKHIEFLGATVGKEQFTTEKPWHRQAKRILPLRLHRWFPPISTGTCSSGTNSITLFFRVTDPTGTPINGYPWAGYRAEDATGFSYQRHGGRCTFGGGPSQVVGLTMRAFPRQQSTFRFVFLNEDDEAMAGFNIPNPVRGPFPEWKPESLPQTISNGLVEVTLESLRDASSSRYNTVRPKWNLRPRSPDWTSAEVKMWTLLDASGNEGRWLSPNEPAWKVHAEVHRKAFEDFAETERVVITNIAVPPAGGFTVVDQTENRLGVTLRIRALVNNARFYVTNGIDYASEPFRTSGQWSSVGTVRVESWASSNLFALVEATGYEDSDDIRQRMLDQNGDTLKVIDDYSSWEGSSQGRIYKRPFRVPADTKTVTLEMVVSRPLGFEFLVDPKEVKTSTPPRPE